MVTCNTSYQFFWKVAKMAILTILGFVQDKHTFSTLSFMKTKLRNQLIEHLPLVVDMKCHVFHGLQTFPYEVTYNSGKVDGKQQCDN
jgi:hypothetical protein